MMRGTLFIAGADLKNMLRQRETLMWVFAMPILFFYFIGTVTGGYGRARGSQPIPLLLQAPANGGVLVDEIEQKLQAQDFAVQRVESDAVAAGAAHALVIAPPASGRPFSDAVTAGERQSLTYRTTSEGSTAQYERLRVSRAVYGVLADLAVLATEQRAADPGAFKALDDAPRLVKLSVQSAGRRAATPTGFAQAIPGTMVMFTMLVSLTSGAVLLVIERRLGLLRRLAATPISRSSVVTGKWLGRLVLAVVQIVVAMITGTVVFKMDWGGALPMVFVLLLTWAAFNASLALVLGSVARSEGQVVGLGVVSSMALGALGGCWWPIEIAPRWMQSLAMFLPTGWAMNAMHRLVSFGDPATVALPHILALSAGALGLGWVGTRVFRYE